METKTYFFKDQHCLLLLRENQSEIPEAQFQTEKYGL